MTAKEKAKELVEKFSGNVREVMMPPLTIRMAKACAIICAEEILSQINTGNLTAAGELGIKFAVMFWESVQQEINKL